mmetsp:Transcript_20065/g.51091  ORF Transcript_20065/g.51091 Transcript_20065/m.51091 type:complete len:215 (-) Transcript_20065:1298-1942(-)
MPSSQQVPPSSTSASASAARTSASVKEAAASSPARRCAARRPTSAQPELGCCRRSASKASRAPAASSARSRSAPTHRRGCVYQCSGSMYGIESYSAVACRMLSSATAESSGSASAAATVRRITVASLWWQPSNGVPVYCVSCGTRAASASKRAASAAASARRPVRSSASARAYAQSAAVKGACPNLARCGASSRASAPSRAPHWPKRARTSGRT